jgi:hypothetical protein
LSINIESIHSSIVTPESVVRFNLRRIAALCVGLASTRERKYSVEGTKGFRETMESLRDVESEERSSAPVVAA